MLNHLGETKAADRIKNAVEQVVNEGIYVTQDLNPQSSCGTVEMGNAIVKALR
jgi:isocitrate dehydrogenase (NAD+)